MTMCGVCKTDSYLRNFMWSIKAYSQVLTSQNDTLSHLGICISLSPSFDKLSQRQVKIIKIEIGETNKYRCGNATVACMKYIFF